MELTEEDIKKMSPEQLRQLQKQQCIFCHIIAKRVQSKIVYEDDKVTAVLDINPANPGHILLLPKEHYSVSPQIPDDLMAYMGMIAKQLSNAVVRAIGAEGTTIIAANGLAAGQRASHFMLHVIPRKEGDKIGIMLPPGEIDDKQMLEFQRLLAPVIAKAFGAVPVEVPKEVPVTKKEAPHEKSPQKKVEEKAQEPEKGETEDPEAKTEKTRLQENEEPKENTETPESPSPKETEPKGKSANLDDITSLLLGGGK
jgi:histidine triad (HIT) family protein